MDQQFDRTFGLVIAYILPGLPSVWGLSFHSSDVVTLLGVPTTAEPSVARFLYVALASLGTGMVVSAVRWGIVDTIHHHSGLAMPNTDFSQLQDELAAFSLAVEHYYRYYQFYSNTVVAGSDGEGQLKSPGCSASAAPQDGHFT